MTDQLVEYVLKSVEYLSKLLRILPLPASAAAAVSLVPPLVGAAQLVWKLLRERTSEHKKKVLQERVVGLREFLESFPENGLSGEETQACLEARMERSGAIRELARLVLAVAGRAGASAEAILQRSCIQKSFLLYAPRPRGVWVLHVLFYFCLVELVGILSVLGLMIATGKAETARGMMAAVGIFTVPVLVFWGLAADLDRSTVPTRNALQRWLLLYAPDRRGRWLWHVLFYVGLVALVSVLGLLLQGETGPEVLLSAGVWLSLLVVFRRAAVRERRSRIERWLLLYAPRRRWVWLLHAFFWVFLIGAVASLGMLLVAVARGEAGAFHPLPTVCFVLISTLILWGLASDSEQERAGPCSRVVPSVCSFPACALARARFVLRSRAISSSTSIAGNNGTIGI